MPVLAIGLCTYSVGILGDSVVSVQSMDVCDVTRSRSHLFPGFMLRSLTPEFGKGEVVQFSKPHLVH